MSHVTCSCNIVLNYDSMCKIRFWWTLDSKMCKIGKLSDYNKVKKVIHLLCQVLKCK